MVFKSRVGGLFLFILVSIVIAGCGAVVTPSITFSPSSTGVALDAAITATGSGALNSSALSTSTFTVIPTSSNNGTTTVCTAVSYNESTNTLTCTHTDLAPGVQYTITVASSIVPGGATGTFTTTTTAGSNTPVPTLVLPNTKQATLSQIQLNFSVAVNSDSVNVGNIKVIENGDTTGTNLVNGVSLNAGATTVTLNLSISYKCNTSSRTRYNVTTTEDVRSSTGSHASKPLNTYFTTADQNFGDSETVGISTGCWSANSGNDVDGGVTINDEIINANTTNTGKLTIQGDPDVDLTDDNDSVPEIAGPNASGVDQGINETAYGVTVKLDTASGLSAAGESAGLVFVESGSGNAYGLSIFPDTQSYQTFLLIGALTTGTAKTVSCTGCFTSASVYACLLRDKDGQVVMGIDAGGTGTFTPIDNSIFTTASSGGMRTLPQLNHASGDVPSMTIDWIRYNLDTSIDVTGTSNALASTALASYCPPISSVQ